MTLNKFLSALIVCYFLPGVALLIGAALLGWTGVELGGGIPAAMSNRG